MAKVQKVHVSSESPVKLRAIEQAFARMGVVVKTVGRSVASDVSA